MESSASKSLIDTLLQSADVVPNGDNPWDLQIYNQHFYSRVLRQGSLGLGESYMDKWWDCEHLDQFIARVLSAKLEDKLKKNSILFFKALMSSLFNLQSKKRSLIVGKTHYDLGNDLFQYMLDTNMNYTCAYWENATDLNTAQENKLKLSAQKLLLKPGMRVLDIGCGFGAMAKYLAQQHDVSVVGITISKQQYEYAKANCAGLPVEIRFQDYRDLNEKFDRITSLGMFEHVGLKNYRTYFEIAKKCLPPDGLFLLHTIGVNTSSKVSDAWIHKYIFPNGKLPSIAQIAKASEGLFVMEDWHNFGSDYDKTLMAWHKNFIAHWPSLKNKYDERFFRLWQYYLLSCAGLFRARDAQLWQIVFSSNGLSGGYQRPMIF